MSSMAKATAGCRLAGEAPPEWWVNEGCAAGDLQKSHNIIWTFRFARRSPKKSHYALRGLEPHLQAKPAADTKTSRQVAAARE